MTLGYLKYVKLCKRYNVDPLPFKDDSAPLQSEETSQLHIDIYNEANKVKIVESQPSKVPGVVFSGLLLGTGLLANMMASILGSVIKPNTGDQQ